MTSVRRRRFKWPWARGHRWLRQIEGGQARNLAEIADREKIDRSYVSRMVNLTTLAPDIQAAILDETLPEEVVLFDLAIDTPLRWQAQRQRVADVGAKVRAGKTQPAAQTGGDSFSRYFYDPARCSKKNRGQPLCVSC